jgi:hypothetical protein
MQVRLGRDWAGTVGVDDLDGDRIALCMLAQRLFLVAGPMRLLDGDFPDRGSPGHPLRRDPRPS